MAVWTAPPEGDLLKAKAPQFWVTALPGSLLSNTSTFKYNGLTNASLTNYNMLDIYDHISRMKCHQ